MRCVQNFVVYKRLCMMHVQIEFNVYNYKFRKNTLMKNQKINRNTKNANKTYIEHMHCTILKNKINLFELSIDNTIILY